MAESDSIHHRIVIIGGGSGGISVAARLARKLPAGDVAIIEPSDKHYYQPLWTLVGAGVFPREVSEREEASVIPRGVTWIRDAVTDLLPDEDTVLTRDGRRVAYDFLVLAPGIQIDWNKVKGLEASLGRDGVCSNYSYDTVEKTWQFIRDFEGGTALITQPSTPIKCGGAPQKVAYLADDYFRKKGIRDRTKIILASGVTSLLAAKRYADVLVKVVERKGIDVRFKYDLTEIRADKKEAVFRDLESGKEVVIPYDMIHATPPQSAPDFVKESPLANEAGWVDVDRSTLQHTRYPNVFSLGDASSLPTSKTGSAVHGQAPVLVENLIAAMKEMPLTGDYNGYTACPVVTGYGRLVMAEFDYDGNPQETFPFDQAKERLSMYLVKKHILPRLYWYGMMKGRW